MENIGKLHFITQDIASCSHPALAELACKGGAKWIQLRVKNKKPAEWLEIARKTKLICDKYNSVLIINDNPDIAKEIKAGGVHLGKDDMSVKDARKKLKNKYIIGGTANSLEDLLKLTKNDANYIGLGPFRSTNTKENLDPVLGIYGITKIVKEYYSLKCRHVPIIAVGGILPEDVKVLLDAGVHGVAVSSAITKAKDKQGMIKKFLKELS
ncbi:MAG: thiamine phosphate synthase [Bacteroidales bacterium]|nr:thiamine phosphate synthase [Bacteroidales bacterium]